MDDRESRARSLRKLLKEKIREESKLNDKYYKGNDEYYEGRTSAFKFVVELMDADAAANRKNAEAAIGSG